MEPVRTPSQAIVIFIFLMITIFNINNEESTSPSSYTELYHDPEEWVEGTASINIQSAYLQKEEEKEKASTMDTMYHMVNYQEPNRVRSKFTNFVHPVSVAWPVR